MKKSKIEIRYALALFQLASEMNIIEEIRNDMLLIDVTCINSKDLRNLLKNPVIKEAKKKKILDEIFGKHVETLTQNFLKLMVRKDREDFVQGIASQFNEVYKEYKGILTVEVTSAVELDESMRKEILAKLIKETGKTIELIEKVDESLIGGFVLKHKDLQYDASFSRELENLRSEFDINLYVKEY